ncbi:hypothetical protein N7470_005978 [Penicillium chermesinum]|nr:hypothetical protein N7470_005978 [Penicillium chermesinum]
MDQQEELTVIPATLEIPCPPCDLSHVDPASVPLPPSPPASPTTPSLSPESTMGPGELGGSARSSPIPELKAKSPGIESPALEAPAPVEESVSFEDFATRYRQSQRKKAQRKRLEQRLRATKVSIGVSARMIRIGTTVQRGLVEGLKHDDKASFITLYHFLHDLQDSCVSAHQDTQDSLDDRGSDAELDHSADFFHQLSPQSRTDLLEILRLVRSDPQFLVDRIRGFSSAQLAAFTASSTALDAGDAAFSSSSRSRSHYSFNRNLAQSAPFKDHAYSFERTDPLSILFCNVFAAPLEPDTPEAHLRLDVWSSVCAQLMSHGSSKFFPLVNQILSSCVTGSNWIARPKFELYLMDILQTGAFLLEHTDTAGLDFAADTMDPLRTEVAEEFFASAVDDLFRVLEDPDAGFPRAVLQFARAVLRKLPSPDMRSRFLEYLFLQWFFPKFLYSALTYPETHGLLLDFHIRKEARDKLLNQVGLRAYSQVFAVLRSMHHFSLRPAVKQRVDYMISRFQSPFLDDGPPELSSADPSRQNPASTFLLLSAADVLSLLNGLFPQSPSSLHTSPSTAGMPSWSGISTSYSMRSEPLAEPGFYRSTNNQSPRPPSQNGSIFSMESSFISVPDSSLSQTAARIRFELTDLDEPIHRPNLEHPSEENWTIFSISKDGHDLTWSLLPDFGTGSSKTLTLENDDDPHTTNLGQEEEP